MTTSQFTAVVSTTTDANFRDWGSKTSAAIAAVGMVKTADTGQIDWATVTRPLSTSTYQGYEIWRFNDTLQATAPIFMKIEYGSAGSSTTSAFRMTVGKGSNGSGTLTGPIGSSTLYLTGTGLSAAPPAYPCFVSSGDGSMLIVALDPNISSYAMFMAIERSRNAAGAATSTGLVVVATGTTYTHNYATGLVSPVNNTYWPVMLPSSSGGLAAGGRAPVFPAILSDGLGNYWQPKCILVYAPGDAPTQSAITVPGFGTYLPLGVYPSSFGNSGQYAAIAWS